jgi:hypothetical protein
MGWERRGKDGKRLVYIRKKRMGKRVTSIYCGSGERGRAAEREDEERREAAKRASEAPKMLQGATPFAAEGATPQKPEPAEDTALDEDAAWARYLGRQPAQRRYMSLKW